MHKPVSVKCTARSRFALHFSYCRNPWTVQLRSVGHASAYRLW